MSKKEKQRKWADMTPKEQEEVKALFMEYESLSEISRIWNLPRTTLSYHANKKANNWSVERELNKAQLFSQFNATKKSSFIKMSNSIIKVMTRAISHLADRDTPPSTREAKDVTVMLESLDKITRLDDGSPTEITGEKVMEMKDIKDIVNLVPFSKKEEDEAIYIEEVKNKTEEK